MSLLDLLYGSKYDALKIALDKWQEPRDLEALARQLLARLKQAISERDAYKRNFDDELAGNKACRAEFGAHENETFHDFIKRLVDERYRFLRWASLQLCSFSSGLGVCGRCEPCVAREEIRHG